MYRPNAGRHVRSAFSASGPVRAALPKTGDRVWCVVLGDRDLGDTVSAWVDSYVVNAKGGAPASFLKRAGTRVVWDAFRGKNFAFTDEAHAEREVADYREESGW